MLLIVSNNTDHTTCDVISWLLHYDVPYIRISPDTNVIIKSFEIKKDEIDFTLLIEQASDKQIYVKSSEITGFWYRRGKINFLYPFVDELEVSNVYVPLAKRLNLLLYLEAKVLTDSIYSHLIRRKHITDFNNSEANKVDYLVLAKEVGFDVPATLVSCNKDDLAAFIKSQPSITKSMYLGALSLNKFSVGAGTEVVRLNDLNKVPSNLAPSCVQEQLDKAYELRIFYLHKKCYSMAIFSQNDEQTQVDFRNYNLKRSNRTPPYKLPQGVEDKIIRFMDKLQLNSGSIDIVVTKDKRYVFLEVNPIGQFSQVSYPCNYSLEKQIAKYFRYDG